MKPRLSRNLVVWMGVTCACLTGFSSCAPVSVVTRLPGLNWLAQEKVNLTPDEFQRLVYSSYVLTVIDAKPELEASLLALLELPCEGPETSPTSLVAPLREALAEYRKETSGYALTVRWRDEILARYFLKLSEVPGLPERRRVVLSLLKVLLARANEPGLLGEQPVWLHAGGQRLLAVERGPGERQALVESCTRRAQSDACFATAMDALLRPESGIALDAPPREILSANAALAESPAMQALMDLSSLSGDGSVVITTAKLKELFTEEMAEMREVIKTDQALHRKIGKAQEDLVGYLDDAPGVAAMTQWEAEAKAGQRERIAASSAAANTVTQMIAPRHPQLAKQMDTVSTSIVLFTSGLAQMCTGNPVGVAAGCLSIIASGIQLATLSDTGPSPDQVILDEIGQVKSMIVDLSKQVDYRFDRVDRSLEDILEELGTAVDLIGEVGRDVDEVRMDLLEAQASLHRLERELYSYLNAGFRRNLVERINGDLGFETRTGESMPWEWYLSAENTFYSWAVSHAKDELSSHSPAPADVTDTNLLGQLRSRPLESNLNYINEFLRQSLKVSSLSRKPVASPRDWYVGASAYLQLAVENPQHFRRISPGRLDDVIRAGTELGDFFRAITFVKSGSSPQVNRELYDAALSYYERKLHAFDETVAAFALDEGVAVSMWREWEARARRFTFAETAVSGVEGYLRRIPTDVVGIAAGVYHSLAIRANGTVVGWGANHSGQCNVPAGLSDVVALSAGVSHSLALRADGTVVAWGDNSYGQCNIPAHEAITKICAGPYHSLALQADGRLIAWGYNRGGGCNVPKELDGVIDIAAAGCPQRDTPEISLALKADGTVVAWGKGLSGTFNLNVPEGLPRIVAIAAHYEQAVAVKEDGTVVGWALNDHPTRWVAKEIDGVTGVAAVAAGEDFAPALQQDGTVEVIAGSIKGTPEAGGIVAIAAGGSHALPLRDDGTVVVWGWGDGASRRSEPRLYHGRRPCDVALHKLVSVGTWFRRGGCRGGRSSPCAEV